MTGNQNRRNLCCRQAYTNGVADERARWVAMSPAEHRGPDSDHANEQRETDERRCFAGDCAKDGVAGVDSAEPGDRQLGIWAGMPVVAPADTPAGPAATGEAKPVIQGRWPSDGLRKTEIP
jgi:hypothetical protein